MKIKNPILPGFHPDPSIVRVGDMYYIATSAFEWWPGEVWNVVPRVFDSAKLSSQCMESVY